MKTRYKKPTKNWSQEEAEVVLKGKAKRTLRRINATLEKAKTYKPENQEASK